MNMWKISTLACVGRFQFALHGLSLCMNRAKFTRPVLACSSVIQSVVPRHFLSEFLGMVASWDLDRFAITCDAARLR